MKITDNITAEDEKVKDILKKLFILSIILIPVDNLPYMSNIMGELGNRGAVYPFILIILIIFVLLIKRKEIYFNRSRETDLLTIFFIWILISSIINMNDIFTNSFKGRSGINKLLLQFMVIGFMVLISYCSDIIIKLKNITLYDFREYVKYSLIAVFIYGTVELLNFTGIIDLSRILKILSSIFQTYFRGEVYTKGIRTISGEVSYFAMYASFAMPWIVSYIFTEKSNKKKVKYCIIAGYLVLLLIFSKSRTAYAIIFIEMFIYTMIILISKVSKNIKINLLKAIALVIIGFVIINNTVLSNIAGDENSMTKISITSLINSLRDPNNVSNISRLGLEEAAINIGIENPIIGVGIGQYGFEVSNHLSDKALTSHEVQRWISEKNKDWPPAFALYVRIMAEQGILGFIIWCVFIGYVLIKSMRKIMKNENDIMGISLVVSFIGVLISWMNADTFAQVAFWIILPFIIRYNNNNLIEDKEEVKEEVKENYEENKFSLIMATCGRKKEVEEFLKSIKAINYNKKLLEVIIVDQNKERILDDIIDKYKSEFNIIHIKSEKIGLALNRNIGLEMATGNIIAFPDDDCEYLKNTLTIVEEYFNKGGIDVVMGKIVERDGSDSLRTWTKEKVDINANNFYTKCSSVTMFLKKGKTIIRFNEKLGAGQYFGACEDADILYKNCKKEVDILYTPEIMVYHPHYSSNVNMATEKIVSYGLGFGAMVKANFDFNMCVLFIKAEGYHFVKSIVYLLQMNTKKSKRSWVAFTSRIKGFIEYKKVMCCFFEESLGNGGLK
ncbi:glycosyltransferase [Clostridium gasigenes]|uniref:Glycosyltransferase n=1 Tax=Clostridium gasigenes TaxID=94869 RepID=A0A7X0S9L1_9CLOT|nr:glycosyltransferase [Clostridium gasigenes]MBB6713517.1 glycosyltransferase [Clostridium gasigenes]